MTSPTTSANTATVSKSGITNIDALLSGEKWGSALSNNLAPLTISYSFPWINGLSAIFSAPGGAEYSTEGEQNATFRFGLNNTQQTAATLALTAWSNVAKINFQLVSETSTNVGDIRFAFSSASSLSDAWGYASYPNSYWPKGGDIWINSEYGSDLDWTVGTNNFESLMHEVGHALGIKHPFEDGVVLSSNFDNSINTIMSYTDIKDVYPNAGYVNGKYDWLTYYINRETPMVLDIAAIQYIYGANNNYKTGDDTYTFDPTEPFFKTIWDAGGKDTISASNFSLGCVIDLTPGKYSSLIYPRPSDAGDVTVTYDGTNNLGIAFNCTIENAIGGSGNDILIGNNTNNILTGGRGDDSIDGGNGIDTVIFSDLIIDAKIIKSLTKWIIKSNNDDSDTLINVERLSFKDTFIALDISANAGTTSKILGAVFGTKSLSNKEYVGLGLDLLDKGMSYDNLGGLALSAARLTSKEQIVTTLFTNVVGKAPTAADKAPFIKMLDDGMPPGALARLAAETPLNANNINLVGLAQTGIEYTPVA
jgi:hypothetical protein